MIIIDQISYNLSVNVPATINVSSQDCVLIAINDGGAGTTSAWANGSPMTRVDNVTSGPFFFLKNPPIGPVSITMNGAGPAIFAMTLLGVSKNTDNLQYFQSGSATLTMGNSEKGMIIWYTNQSVTVPTEVTSIYRETSLTVAYSYVSGGFTTATFSSFGTNLVGVFLPESIIGKQSIYNPNLDFRNSNDISGLLNAQRTASGNHTYGSFPTQFYLNSFLHTVGRIPPPPPVSVLSSYPNTPSNRIIPDQITRVTQKQIFDHNVCSPDAVLILLVGGFNIPNLLPTLNGVTISPIVSSGIVTNTGDEWDSYIYYIPNPQVGSNTINLTTLPDAIAITLLGVNKRNVIPQTFSANAIGNANPSLNISAPLAGSLVIDALSPVDDAEVNVLTVIPQNNQLQISNLGQSGSSNALMSSFKVFNSSTDQMTWNVSGANVIDFAYTAIVLEPDRSYSIYSPAISNRNNYDIIQPNNLSTGQINSSGSYDVFGNYPYNFFQNSFLHTVGRINSIFIPPISIQNLINLSQGLVAFYKYDENTGGNVKDELNTYPATWTGTFDNPWETDSLLNSGGRFNSTSTVATSLVLPTVGSVSLWYKYSVATANSRIIGGEASDTGIDGLGIGLQFSNNSIIAIARNNGTVGDVTSNAPPSTTFEHLVVTWGAGGVNFYRNGVNVGNNNAITSITTGGITFNMGGPGTGSAANFLGILDDVGIWNRELSSDEVMTLYNNGRGFSYPFVYNQFAIGVSGYNYYSQSQTDYWQTSFLQTIGRIPIPSVAANVFNTTLLMMGVG